MCADNWGPDYGKCLPKYVAHIMKNREKKCEFCDAKKIVRNATLYSKT
jgi:ribosomal protein L37AE/L43A